MSPVHVDMKEIEAALVKARAAMEPIGLQNDSAGAQARMTVAVHHAFSRHLADEINRNTSWDLTSDGLAAVCANMICDFVGSGLPEDATSEQQLVFVEHQMLKVARCLGQRFNGEARNISNHVVRTQKGGRA
jgi:hypothetical protein